MATAAVERRTVVTLTLTEDEAIGLKTLLNFARCPAAIEHAPSAKRVCDAVETIFDAMCAAEIPCKYLPSHE